MWRIERARGAGRGIALTVTLLLTPAASARSDESPQALRVDVVATGLEAPWALAFAPMATCSSRSGRGGSA